MLSTEVDAAVGAGDGAGMTDLATGLTLLIAHFAKRDASERTKAALGLFAVVVFVEAVFGGIDVDVAIGADHVDTVVTNIDLFRVRWYRLCSGLVTVSPISWLPTLVLAELLSMLWLVLLEETGFLDVGFAVVVVG